MKYLLCVLLLCPALSMAASSQDSPVNITVLDNGLTVLVQPTSSSQSVAIYALVKTGSSIENGCIGCGLSHYVERMLFKGTQRRKVGDIPKEVKSLGGVINAQTGFDDTVYTLDLPVGNWKIGMDLIGDMLTNAVFDPQEAQRERTVIHGEMRLYNDQPSRKLSELVFKNVYLYHPYRHPIIGYAPIFDAVNREQLFAYFKERYAPNNIILSVSGAVDPKEVVALAKNIYKNFKPQPLVDHNLPVEPEVIYPRRHIEEYPTNLYHFSYSFHGVRLLDKDLYALDLLANVLGGGESALLYQEIYQKNRLVEDVSASNFTPLDKGIFEIEFQMSKDNLEIVLDQINAVINRH